ncbi:MAG: hypothetical protein HON04_02940 [Planctomicrobium sp.]|nr:hypothetical protein [Planctomicrobium sp.]
MVSTTAISVILPYGGLLSLILFFALLSWFFELEGMEIIVFTVVLWGMRYLVLIALAIIIGMFLVAMA